METGVERWSGSFEKYQFWKRYYYGTLRYGFYDGFSLARTVPHFLPTEGLKSVVNRDGLVVRTTNLCWG